MMNVPEVAEPAASIALSATIGAVVGFLAGVFGRVAADVTRLLIGGRLEERRLWRKDARERLIERRIDVCLNWLRMVRTEHKMSRPDRAYAACVGPESMAVPAVQAALDLEDVLCNGIGERVRGVFNIVGEVARSKGKSEPTAGQDEELDRLPKEIAQLEWWREKLECDPLLGPRRLEKLRKEARKRFQDGSAHGSSASA